jgi:hypothetical protein
MAGIWKWIAGFGAGGAVLIFLLSAWRNPIGTTLLRSVYAFVAFAALAGALRLLLGRYLVPQTGQPAPEEPEERGRHLDLTTPDEEEALNQLIREQWTGGSPRDQAAEFKPLNPKRLVTLDHVTPEELASAVRRMSEGQGR